MALKLQQRPGLALNLRQHLRIDPALEMGLAGSPVEALDLV